MTFNTQQDRIEMYYCQVVFKDGVPLYIKPITMPEAKSILPEYLFGTHEILKSKLHYKEEL